MRSLSLNTASPNFHGGTKDNLFGHGRIDTVSDTQDYEDPFSKDHEALTLSGSFAVKVS